ncbi:hypothetical protein [Falsiroseomonas oryzae]|uniref:hypothetical protein n=1 Tax=Falsiroseomonas oryzae TaxID=2766473 RepID=UPI0022EA2CB0|nr:hypothetical protein [Roseomonas sp. MO-31]
MSFARVLPIAFAVAAPLAVEAAEIRSARFQNWTISSHSSDRTGQFSHCAANASYRSGIVLLFSINENQQWTIGFLSRNWNLRPGSEIDLTYFVDNRPPRPGVARALDANLVLMPLPPENSLFQQMRAGQVLTVLAAGQTFQFSLTGTSVMLQTLLDCSRSRGNITVAVPQPAPPQAPTPTQSAQPRDRPPSTSSAERRLEATQFVANLLSDSGMRGFRIMTTSEMQREDTIPHIRAADVAWQGDGTLGTLHVLSGPAAGNLDRQASEIIASDARDCPGEFMTARVADAEMRNVRRLMTFCTIRPNESLALHYMLLPMPGGIAYQLAIIGRAGRDAASVEDQRLRDAVHSVVTRHPALGPSASERPTPSPELPVGRRTFSN